MSKLLIAVCLVAVIASAVASPPVQVFVTKGKYTGKQVGILGASICDFEASDYGMSGFQPVIGKTGNKLKFRVPDFGNFINTEGDTIATDGSFFFSLTSGPRGGLDANILGLSGEYSTAASAWTGYDSVGVAADNCQNWTSDASSDFGYAGAFQPTNDNSKWFTGSTHGCDSKKPVICVKETDANTCDGNELALGTTLINTLEEIGSVSFGRRCYVKSPLLSGFNIKGGFASGYCCRAAGKIVSISSVKNCKTGCTATAVTTPGYKYIAPGNVGATCWVDCYRLDA